MAIVWCNLHKIYIYFIVFCLFYLHLLSDYDKIVKTSGVPL